MRLEGKVALITGGRAGIGKTCVGLFAREGAKVVLADFNSETGAATAHDAREHGGEVVFAETVVSNPEHVERAVGVAVCEFGGLDLLYNNMGGSTLNNGPVTTAPFEELQKKISVDLFGTWRGCRNAIPQMIKRGGGTIVNATSICTLRGMTKQASCTAAKGAIASLTRSIAVEFAQHKIRVDTICPGSTLTERILERRKSGHSRPGMAQRHLLGLIEPIDIAYSVLFLSCEESHRITGQIPAIDSGFAIG